MTPSHKNQCCEKCTTMHLIGVFNPRFRDCRCECHSPEKEVKTSGYSAPDWSTFKPVSASQEELLDIVDDGTREITIPTPDGWKCDRPGCEADYLHIHGTFPPHGEPSPEKEPTVNLMEPDVSDIVRSIDEAVLLEPASEAHKSWEEESWEKELRRQCDIRHLPYQDVRYLVSELRSQAIEEERQSIAEQIAALKAAPVISEEDWVRNDAFELARNVVLALLTKEDNE